MQQGRRFRGHSVTAAHDEQRSERERVGSLGTEQGLDAAKRARRETHQQQQQV